MRKHTPYESLVDAATAAEALGVSKSFLFRLPKTTPGVFKFGTAVRFDVAVLRGWARVRRSRL